MNLECKIPPETPLQILARIDDDPMFSHYSPCELSGLLARMWIMTFRLNHGEIVIEITDEGYRALQGASK